jgi:hypothetical protein
MCQHYYATECHQGRERPEPGRPVLVVADIVVVFGFRSRCGASVVVDAEESTTDTE